MYDDANRLTSAGGVAQTWSDNGNLLSDGTSTYAYDHANRLASVVQGTNAYTFAYSGLGDRLRQTINGAPTNYTLDLNAGLTQVLADGSNTYLYGLGRIGEQQPAGFVYHLPDGLGSVRQLTNAAGILTMARSYQPYGSVLSTAGLAATTYGFAGEATDISGLVYLRARYYAPAQGRFLTADSWPGDVRRPLSLNGWNYVEGNPINRVDPSGHCFFVPPIDTWICAETIVAIGTVAVGIIALSYPSPVDEAIRNGVLADPAAPPPEFSGSQILVYPGRVPPEFAEGYVEKFPGSSAVPPPPPLIFEVLDELMEWCRNPIPFPLSPIDDWRNHIYAATPYDFGRHRDISQPAGDDLDSHHVPQFHPASQVIPGLNRGDAPAIALPPEEHQSIPRRTGPFLGTDRDLLAEGISDLRTYTNTPGGVIRDFLRFIKQTLPGAFHK